jgi:hypothetical protein
MENPEDKQDSRYRIANNMNRLTDSELIDVLKKRKLYQPEAAELAILEAIRRGIIHSEQDLFSPGFETPATKFSLFPYPDSDTVRDKILKSLMRSLMIVALIPVYFGVMKFGVSKYAEGTALISLGVIWVALAWFIMNRAERRIIYPMILLTILSMIYAGRILFAFQYLSWTDILFPIILFLFIVYALFYAYTLLRKQDVK